MSLGCIYIQTRQFHFNSFIDEDIALLLLVDVGDLKAVVKKKNPRLAYKSRILLGENWMPAHLSKR